MRKYLSVAGIIFAFVLAGFASSGLQVDLDAERAALAAADAGHAASFKGGDLDEVLSFFAPEAVLFPPCGGRVEGEERRKGTEEFLAAGGEVHYRMDRAVVAPGGDMGYTYGSILSGSEGADGQPATHNGWNTHIWKKNADGRWQIVLDTWTSISPNCEAAE